MFFKLNSSPVITIMLASGGTPVTGLTHTDVACYISKNGAAPVAYTLTVGNFTELSAANMPGLYSVLFTSAQMNTLGEWIALFKDPADLGTFDQYAAKAQITTYLYDDIHARVVTAEGTLQGDITASEGVVTTALTGTQTALTTEINVNEGKIDLVNTNLSGFSDDITDLDTLVTNFYNDFNTRVSGDLALKEHLIGVGGTENAPAGIGIWDVLGNGDVTLGDIDMSLKRVLGLVHENFAIRNQTYDGVNNLISATVKIYPTGADTLADTNALDEYTITASYDAQKRLTSYTMVRN